MGKFKLNKKHLFSFVVVLVLLFSLNINTFAAFSSFHFLDSDYVLSYDDIDCTSSSSAHSEILELPSGAYNASIFVFPGSALNYDKYFIFEGNLNLYTNTDYYFHMLYRSGAASVYSTAEIGILIYYYVDGEYCFTDTVYESEVPNGQWYDIDGEYTTADLSGDVTCTLVFIVRSNDIGASSGLRFTFTDLEFTSTGPIGGSTSGGNYPGGGNDSGGNDSGGNDSGGNPIYPPANDELNDTLNQILTGTPISTPSTDGLQNSIDEYENVMGELPQVDNAELEDLMQFDFDSFADGMAFTRDIFETILTIFDFNAILIFALTIGLATYIIGRKVG